MRPSNGGGGNLMHYFGVLSLLYIVKRFFFASPISVGS